jgi:alkylhydroperoxidase/carboxymuconolactone decarboxylase family protein YurZ
LSLLVAVLTIEEEIMVESAEELPSGADDLARAYPAIWKTYSALGEACTQAGPLEGKALRLVKLALAIGASSEGAVHSHVRRAREEGIADNELKHVALLAIPTLGFPQAIKVLTWIKDVTDGG